MSGQAKNLLSASVSALKLLGEIADAGGCDLNHADDCPGDDTCNCEVRDGNAHFSAVYSALDAATASARDLLVQRDALRNALEQIANHPHCSYSTIAHEPRGDRQYEIGAADGHRCAAEIARAALRGAQSPTAAFRAAVGRGEEPKP